MLRYLYYMHRYLLIMLLSLAGFTAVAQTPQAVLISGRILDVGDSMGLPYVNIWGKQSNIGGTTGVDGTFIM